MGARKKDVVRARTADRREAIVEGILDLRLVPALNYVQPDVLLSRWAVYQSCQNPTPESMERMLPLLSRSR